MNDDENFGEFAARMLRDTRARAGCSLREAARRAGTSHATLHSYESGRKVPSVATFLRILNALGFAVELNLHPRIRWQDGIPRGEELESVLALAEQFPAKVPRRMDYPVFPGRPWRT